MKQILLLPLFLFTTILSFGQASLNLKEIEQLTTDSTSDYFYPRLALDFNERLESFDSVKTKFLYYGKLYKKGYRMFQMSTDEIEFNKLLNKSKYKKAAPIGERMLREDPANIEIILRLNQCYRLMGLKKNEDTTLYKLTLLLNTVLQSGSGKEMENAYKVVAIGDEYAFMAWAGVVGLSRQSLMKGSSTIDSWKVRDTKSGKRYDMHFEWLVNIEQNTKTMKLLE